MSKSKKIQTLCIIHQDNKILLGLKKRGFGQGRWNGFGGKLKTGESVEECACRELVEEAGITPQKFERVGIVDFEFKQNNDYIEVHIFRITEFNGQPTETEEMRPQWFKIDALPMERMWPDDQYWYPLFLKNKKFKGKFIFNDISEILDHKILEVENL